MAGRVLITLVGISLLTWGLCTVVLGLVGEETTAVITHVRREGGERDDGRSGRYTHILSYTFHMPDGRSIDGFAREISNGAYLKHPNTVTKVRYLKAFPALNALASETKPNFGQTVLIALGCWLIWVANKRLLATDS